MSSSTPTRVCAPIISATPPPAEQVEAARRAGADMVELRVDLMGDIDAVEALLRAGAALPVILTIRSAAEGGAWNDDDAARIALLERLGLLSPGLVDVELATWARSANLRQKVGLVGARSDQPVADRGAERPRNVLILSHHDLRETPRDIDAIFDRLLAAPAGVVKAAFTAADATDALRTLLALRRAASHRPTIALSMGEAGVAARVLSRKFGAFLTFAVVDRERASAPGQPTIAELRGLYRWDRIGADTPVRGVVGWPVSQSQSPHVHNAAMEAADLDGVYVRFPVRPEAGDFDAFMDLIDANPALDIDGLSVTLPHKTHALAWLLRRGGEISDLARRCGAVNTLARRGGAWRGDNTDAAGVLAALAPAGPWRGRRAAVLGAGGAARAAVAALRDAGVEVVVLSRTHERSAELAAALGAGAAPWDQRGVVDVDLIVNCTSVGMAPDVEATPMPAAALRPGLVVFDTVYRPRQTRLLRDAQAAGATAIEGAAMFLHQAAAQFEIWCGQPAPIDAMRTALRAAEAPPR